jgi:hypothetical protein
MMWKIPAKTLEIIWLITAILAIIAGIHKTYFQGIQKSYQFLIIFLLALLMYVNRRNLRKSK